MVCKPIITALERQRQIRCSHSWLHTSFKVSLCYVKYCVKTKFTSCLNAFIFQSPESSTVLVTTLRVSVKSVRAAC